MKIDIGTLLSKYSPHLVIISAFVWAIFALFWVNPTPLNKVFVYEQKEEYAKAIPILDALLKKAPSKKKASDLVGLYIKYGYPENGESLYHEYELSPQTLDLLIEAYRNQRKNKRLIKALLHKQTLFPQDDKITRELITLYEGQRNFRGVIQQLNHLIEQDPQPQHYKKRGDVAFYIGDNNLGLASYSKRAQMLDTEATWRELGQLYFFHNRIDEGLKIYHNLAKSNNTLFAWRELADLHFLYNREDEGKTILRQASKEHPELRQHLLGLYRQNQNYSAMIVEMKVLIKKSPNNPDLYQELGELHFAKGNVSQGLAAYKKRAEIIDSVEIWKELAQLYFYKKRSNQGLQIYRKAAEKEDSPQTWKTLAQLYFNYNKNDSAFAAYEQLAKREASAKTWKELSDLYLWKKRIAASERALKNAVKLDSTYRRDLITWYRNRSQYTRMAQELDILSKENPQNPLIFEELGQAWLLANQTDKALDAFHKSAEIRDDEAYWKQLAERYFQNNRDENGLNIFLYLARTRNTSKAWEELAQAYLYKGKIREGLAIHRKLAEEKDTPEVWKNLVQLYFAEKLFDEGFQIYEEFAQRHNDAKIWKELADLYFWQKRPKDGVRALNKAAQRSSEYRRELIEYHKQQQNYSDATFQLELLILTHPDRLPLYQELSDLYFLSGNVDKGLETYRKKTEKEKTIQSWKTLAQLYFSHQRFQEGLAIHQQLAEENNQASLWKELAELYFWKKQPEKGEVALKKANDLESNLENTKALAQRFENQNRPEEAEKYYIQAVNYYPTPQQGEIALAQFYVRQGNPKKAFRRLKSTRQQYKFSTDQNAYFLQVATWAGEQETVHQVLKTIPAEKLPDNNLDYYYQQAVYAGFLTKAEEILAYQEQRSQDQNLWNSRLQLSTLKGNPEEAVQILKQQIQKEGETLELLEKLYQTYESYQNREGQRDTLDRILQKVPNNVEWLTKAQNFYTFYGEFDQGVDALMKRYKNNPTKEKLIPLIPMLISAKSADLALQLILELPKDQLDDDLINLAIDAGYISQKIQPIVPFLEQRYFEKKSLEDLDALLAIFNSSGNTSKELYYLLHLLKNQHTIPNKIYFINVLQKSQCSDEAWKQASTLQAEVQSPRNVKELAEVSEAFEDKRLAIDLYKRLLDSRLYQQQGRRQLVDLYMDQSQYNEAIPLLEAHVQKKSKDWKSRLKLAEVYQEAKIATKRQLFFEELAQDFRKRSRFQKEADQKLFLASLLFSQNFTQMLQNFERFQKTKSSPKVFLEWFLNLLREHGYESIILEDFQPDRTDTQQMATYYRTIYNIYNLQKKSNEALESLRNWVQYDSENKEAWQALAYAAWQRGQKDQALQAFKKVRQLSKKSSSATTAPTPSESITSSTSKSPQTCPFPEIQAQFDQGQIPSF